jgi:hypothetical protein
VPDGVPEPDDTMAAKVTESPKTDGFVPAALETVVVVWAAAGGWVVKKKSADVAFPPAFPLETLKWYRVAGDSPVSVWLWVVTGEGSSGLCDP